MIRALALWLLILACAGTLVAWNMAPFRAAEPRIRAKDLSFLPAPDVARSLALGHANSVARLRWIDSFAYFQFQIDRRNDALPDGSSGFQRLYDLLIALDPHFAPFYHHAGLNTGAVAGRMDRALGYLLRGTIELPHDTSIWRHAASVLNGYYSIGATHPQQMESFLRAWADAETDENGRMVVQEWMRTMARRQQRGLEQLPYWLEQLAASRPGSSAGDYVERTIREQLTRYAFAELGAVVDQVLATGRPVDGLSDLLDPEIVSNRRIDARWGPFGMGDGRLALRSDPFGYPYVWRDGAVDSLGLEYALFEQVVGNANRELDARAQQEGRFPHDVREAVLWSRIGDPPAGVTLVLEHHQLRADYPPPVAQAWPLREMHRAR